MPEAVVPQTSTADAIEAANAASEAAPPVAPPAAPSAPSISAELLERATKHGLDFSSAQSDKDFAAALFDAYEANLPFAQHGRQALATPPVQPVEEPQEPEEAAFDLDKHFSEAWKLPELSAGAQWALSHGAFTENEQGAIVAKPGLEQAALPYIREIQEHVRAKERLTEDFQKNPVRFMYDKLIPALRHELRTDFEQIDRETRTASEAEAFEKQFIEQNKDWLFQNGQLSAAGQKFQQEVQRWRAKGVSDYEALASLAMQTSRPSAPPAPANPQTPAAQVAAPQRTDRGDGRASDGTFVSKQESFLESAKRQSAASAGGGRSTQSPEDFVPANRGELESIWTQAFRKQSAGVA